MRSPAVRRVVAAAIGATAIVVLAGTPAVSAVFQASPPTYLDVRESGKVVARGAAVQIPVDVMCKYVSYSRSYLTVTVTEKVNGKVTTGTIQLADPVVCDSTIRTVNVVVPAQTRAFKKGTVAVTAVFEQYGRNDVHLTDQAVIPVS
ncbi:MAG TPA: hypothetical protein VFL59_16065 [Candidatus Nanopelagicales bacterium]|nr:hypothetical protein [Candidatus Nanopelagicales bacterium]